jgi:GAF domain-containing protein
MEDLGLFANQAAIAIEQSRTNRNLAALLGEVLQSIAGTTDSEGRELQEPARAFTESLEEDATFSQALNLARLVQEIAHQGENELQGCQAILRGFAEYLRSRPEPIGDLGTVR